jgi:predicted nucleotidyltransferase
LAVTANEHGVDLLLVGAFAREVLFYHMCGIETGISTMDTDISVHVTDWASFNRLRMALKHEGFQLEKDTVEKVVDEKSGKEVDLIPFGPVAGFDARLVWPNNGPTWNVLGFEEALAFAARSGGSRGEECGRSRSRSDRAGHWKHGIRSYEAFLGR